MNRIKCYILGSISSKRGWQLLLLFLFCGSLCHAEDDKTFIHPLIHPPILSSFYSPHATPLHPYI